MGSIWKDVRSTGLGGAVKEIKRASKHTDKKLSKARTTIRKGVVKSNKSVGARVKNRMIDADKMRVYDKLSDTGKAAMIKSEMSKQTKANKKKYGYEYAKPINLKKYSNKATKQRNMLAGAKAKPKYNKWGDRVS
jgi:hypothetical protein